MTDPSKDVMSDIESRINKCCCSNVVYNDEVLALIELIRAKDDALKALLREISISELKGRYIQLYESSPNIDYAKSRLALTESLGK